MKVALAVLLDQQTLLGVFLLPVYGSLLDGHVSDCTVRCAARRENVTGSGEHDEAKKENS